MTASIRIPPPTIARVALVCALTGTAAAAVACAKGGSATSAAHEARPNIVVVQTDDQTLATLSEPHVMPFTHHLIAEHGTAFSDYVVTTPACCPSRSSLLTGQYAHNHGVTSNRPGYPSLRHKHDVLPVWLQRAGYRTAHLGKFPNGWNRSISVTAIPPGWDYWYTLIKPYHYYDYRVADNGRVRMFGLRPRDYVTTRLNRAAAGFVKQAAPGPKPFFLELDEFAPHGQGEDRSLPCGDTAVPAPRDVGRFDDVPVPRPPSFNEADISDKPSFISDLPRLGRHATHSVRNSYDCRLAALRSVDRGVKGLAGALAEDHELADTVFVITSDNGYFFGEHRLPKGKDLAYEEGIRVPFSIRLPRAVRGADVAATVSQPTANIDIAPTLLELAGAEPCASPTRCRVLDGRSLVGLATGSQDGWPADRALALEFDAHHNAPTRSASCEFHGVRTADHEVYIEHDSATTGSGGCLATGEAENYDLATDPYELHNLWPPRTQADQAHQDELSALTARLADCAGIAGRDPLPPSGHYCQ
jgi:N-acetylglucosamine-6-sulfatase